MRRDAADGLRWVIDSMHAGGSDVASAKTLTPTLSQRERESLFGKVHRASPRSPGEGTGSGRRRGNYPTAGELTSFNLRESRRAIAGCCGDNLYQRVPAEKQGSVKRISRNRRAQKRQAGDVTFHQSGRGMRICRVHQPHAEICDQIKQQRASDRRQSKRHAAIERAFARTACGLAVESCASRRSQCDRTRRPRKT